MHKNIGIFCCQTKTFFGLRELCDNVKSESVQQQSSIDEQQSTIVENKRTVE